MVNKGLVTTLLALCLSVARAGMGDIETVELPSGALTSWVATDMNHNGHGMVIKALSVPRPVEDVMSFYRAAWEAKGAIPGFVENEVDGWQVLSRLSDSHSLVVQIKSGSEGNTEGYISSMALIGETQRGIGAIPIPPNAAKVSHTRTSDKGKTGYTTILVTPASISAAVGYYNDHLDRAGWSRVSDDIVAGSHVLKFNKRQSTFEIVVSAAEDGTTVILLNRTQGDG